VNNFNYINMPTFECCKLSSVQMLRSTYTLVPPPGGRLDTTKVTGKFSGEILSRGR